MHEGKIAAHLRYYEDYIQSRVRAGTDEEEVIAALGDPRLIAKTLIDTDTDTGVYEEAENYSRFYSDEDTAESQQDSHVHHWKLDLSTWYGKLIVIAIVLLIISLVITVLTAIAPFLIALAVILFVINWLKKR
jgi:uncharacterized membrane protein